MEGESPLISFMPPFVRSIHGKGIKRKFFFPSSPRRQCLNFSSLLARAWRRRKIRRQRRNFLFDRKCNSPPRGSPSSSSKGMKVSSLDDHASVGRRERKEKKGGGKGGFSLWEMRAKVFNAGFTRREGMKKRIGSKRGKKGHLRSKGEGRPRYREGGGRKIMWGVK